MKKFKIKNRVKRKYVRKDVSHQTFSLSKSGMGIAPTLFAIVGLLTTYIIVTSPTDTIFANIAIPLPQIVIPLSQISLPNVSIPAIDYSPIIAWLLQLQTSIAAIATIVGHLFTAIQQSLLASMQESILSLAIALKSAGFTTIDFLGHIGAAFAVLLGKYLMYSWQIRVDFYTSIGSQIVGLYAAWMTGSLLFAVTIWQIAVAKSFLMITQLVSFYQGSIGLLTTSFTAWTQSILFIKQTIAIGVYWVFTTLIIVIKSVIAFGNAVIDLLLLPFKLIGAYLVQTKPFWIAFGKLIEHANNEFILGFKNLGMATQAISGK